MKKISRALGRVNLKSIDQLLATFDDLTVKIDEVTSKLNPIFLEHPGLGFSGSRRKHSHDPHLTHQTLLHMLQDFLGQLILLVRNKGVDVEGELLL